MKEFKHTLIETIETLLVSFIIIFTLYGLVASIEVISGASMEPNFFDKERILVDRITPLFDKYSRGDVVVFTPPIDRNAHFIKRVVGLPGETVKIFDCRVYITKDSSRFVLEESFLAESACTSGGNVLKEGRSYVIPEGSYLLLGDNRGASVDSRYFGLVDSNAVVGRVIFMFWPLNKIGFVD